MKMRPSISRRSFLGALGLAVAGANAGRLPALESRSEKIRLGMMLQGTSIGELQARAKAVAAVGFKSVQVTFFFHPTADELKSLAQSFKELKLAVRAFGTYFNLFHPDDTSFMRSSQATMKLVAAHADAFDCRQFVTWSASYSPQFAGADPRNDTPEAVVLLQRAIREVVLPILDPIGGRVAMEPFFRHVVGTLELTRQVLKPFPAERVGIVLDPPNYITPALYATRDDELRRLFAELGDRIHIAHFKDMKLNPQGTQVMYPGPGGGQMNYRLLVSEIRKLNRPLNCIIEHIPAEPAAMSKTKAWVEGQLRNESV